MLAWIENLVKELVEIFPDEYIHIGGDEADFCSGHEPKWRSAGFSSGAQFMTEVAKLALAVRPLPSFFQLEFPAHCSIFCSTLTSCGLLGEGGEEGGALGRHHGPGARQEPECCGAVVALAGRALARCQGPADAD